jgi:hypothetical protein
MKSSFLAASLLALGGLGAIAPSASAAFPTVNVPFAGTVLQTCTAVPLATPGVLALASEDNATLTSEDQTVTGTLTVVCNTGFRVTTGEPVETTALPTKVDHTSASSSIRSIQAAGLDLSNVTGAVSPTLSANLLHTVKVDMSATSADAIEAGVYSFDVPVTVTAP